MSAHTAGALRAAKSAVQVVIEHDGIMECDARDAAEMFAEIIDRETGVKELVETLEGIANAKPSEWDESVRDQFKEWAQSRARFALAKHKGEHA